MLRKMLASVVAAVFLAVGLVMVQGVSASVQAAPQKQDVKKVTNKRVARHKKAVRKVNFVSRRAVQRKKITRRTAATKKRKATTQKRRGVRVAALFGGASKARPQRREGQIYDASGRYLGKTVVKFDRKLKPGTILVKTRERALYYVLPGGKAEKYGVGVGREGFQWSGVNRISAKKKWPEWRPPEEMKQRELIKYGRKLPDVMPGGPDNPLGARALYIGSTLYRIHGTNNPRSIGKFVSSGCIRMVNDEVSELYDKVKIGARVIVED